MCNQCNCEIKKESTCLTCFRYNRSGHLKEYGYCMYYPPAYKESTSIESAGYPLIHEGRFCDKHTTERPQKTCNVKNEVNAFSQINGRLDDHRNALVKKLKEIRTKRRDTNRRVGETECRIEAIESENKKLWAYCTAINKIAGDSNKKPSVGFDPVAECRVWKERLDKARPAKEQIFSGDDFKEAKKVLMKKGLSWGMADQEEPPYSIDPEMDKPATENTNKCEHKDCHHNRSLSAPCWTLGRPGRKITYCPDCSEKLPL